MSVKKALLANKTDKELEAYLKEGNGYVVEAIEYAFEILKARGRIFSEEEIERIDLLIAKEMKTEQTIIHPNHTKAARLLYLSAVLYVPTMILNADRLDNVFGIIVSVVTLMLITAIGYAASRGSNNIKFLLLVILIVGLGAVPSMLFRLFVEPFIGIIEIAGAVLQFYALVLWFQTSPISRKQPLVWHPKNGSSAQDS
jgi:hypothetical protein